MAEAVYLTAARAKQAVELATPAILKLMESGLTHNKWIRIVVLGVEGQIIYEGNVGPDAGTAGKWLEESTLFARGKAAIHFRTGKPSIEAQARRPNALIVGDTIHGGSASYEGVIVAASWVQGYFDEAIAGTVAAILWGLCMDAQAKYMGKADRKTFYEGAV